VIEAALPQRGGSLINYRQISTEVEQERLQAAGGRQPPRGRHPETGALQTDPSRLPFVDSGES